jgi:carbon starvation protein CstA
MDALMGLNAVTLIFVALCVFAIGYRFYGVFIAGKVLKLDEDRPMPAVTQADGTDYVKTNKYVLFGHHFTAITAAGPLLGPVLVTQFGFLPVAMWILIGAVLAGAVHDMVVLFASTRHRAQSLAKIAEAEEIRMGDRGAGDFHGLCHTLCRIFEHHGKLSAQGQLCSSDIVHHRHGPDGHCLCSHVQKMV